MGVILSVLGVLLITLVAVILVRTLRFEPAAVKPAQPEKIDLNEEKIVADMANGFL